MDAHLSNTLGLSNESGTDSGDPLGDTGAHRHLVSKEKYKFAFVSAAISDTTSAL